MSGYRVGRQVDGEQEQEQQQARRRACQSHHSCVSRHHSHSLNCFFCRLRTHARSPTIHPNRPSILIGELAGWLAGWLADGSTPCLLAYFRQLCQLSIRHHQSRCRLFSRWVCEPLSRVDGSSHIGAYHVARGEGGEGHFLLVICLFVRREIGREEGGKWLRLEDLRI
ncbi:hypothetical protein BKA80DRAFT_69835 [Phyllosticta citrichinensis]